ncbi:hypothetical protein L204_102001 [Cryptococcus depauperatus]
MVTSPLSKPKRGKIAYSPAYIPPYDPEKGLVSSPTHLARQLLVLKKPRWILVTLLCVGAGILYINSGNPPRLHRPHDSWYGDKQWGPGGPWDEDEIFAVGQLPHKSNNSSTRPHKFIVDQNGNHFIQDWNQSIAPMHPHVSHLPRADLFFENLNVHDSGIPVDRVFPDSNLRQIVSDPPDAPLDSAKTMPSDAWSQTWKAPDVWDRPRGEMKHIQWEGFAYGRENWESEEEKKVREERRNAIKRGFKHAWEAYKKHAWGHDEIKPVSMTPSDPFNGWGATIVDSLDTLLIMEFSEEYNLCRSHINQLNFHWINGRDWSQGYISEPLSDGEVFALMRDKTVGLPVFEVSIRYLGGLIGAYDLSGDQLLIERAIELAEILGTAFKTTSGLPAGRINPGTEDEMIGLGIVSLAEVGSMSVELIRLSQITKDRKWFDLAQRVMDYINEMVIPRSAHSPLIPMQFQPDAPVSVPMRSGFTFGGRADSYYEYLIKTYQLLGASEVSKVWRDTYERSIDKAKEVLYVEIGILPDHDILTIGKLDGGRLIPELEHLTCFAGAMLGLGAKLLDRPGDMKDAVRLTSTCYWLSADTPTGLQPEAVEWFEPHQTSQMYENVTLLNNKAHHPLVINKDDYKGRDGIHRDRNGVLRWNEDDEPVVAEKNKTGEVPIEYVQRLKGVPTGTRKVTPRGLNRPETIESIFYMYRLTGDRKWQEKGWRMFSSWAKTSTVDGGFSSVSDVTTSKVRFSDNMESFALAETLKYHYLLQSEPDLLSLDDYVFNTEAHPLLISPELDPTIPTAHTRFWNPPTESQELGVRGQGTNVQKFARLELIERASSPFHSPSLAMGGGRGMGGGNGKPEDRPKPPPKVFKLKGNSLN